MCFSATVSFSAAAATGAIGTATLSQSSGWREKPLAAIPLVFAAQQLLEGGQWLVLEGVRLPVSSGLLANGYALLAFALWPVLFATAVLLVEPERRRRLAMVALALLGAFVALYGLLHISAHPYDACILGHSIVYSAHTSYPHVIFAAYLVSGFAPLLLTSHRIIRRFGAIVAAGLAVAWLAFFKARFSVWCFFSAAASLVLYFHFARAARARAPLGPPG